MACGATMMPFAISPLEDLHFSPGMGSDFGGWLEDNLGSWPLAAEAVHPMDMPLNRSMHSELNLPTCLEDVVLGKRKQPECSVEKPKDLSWALDRSPERKPCNIIGCSIDSPQPRAPDRNKRKRRQAVSAVWEAPSLGNLPDLPDTFVPVSQVPSQLCTSTLSSPVKPQVPLFKTEQPPPPISPNADRVRGSRPPHRRLRLALVEGIKPNQPLDAKASWNLALVNHKYFGTKELEAKAMLNRYLQRQGSGKRVGNVLTKLEDEVSAAPLKPKCIPKKRRQRRPSPGLSRFGREHLARQDTLKSQPSQPSSSSWQATL